MHTVRLGEYHPNSIKAWTDDSEVNNVILGKLNAIQPLEDRVLAAGPPRLNVCLENADGEMYVPRLSRERVH